MEWIAELFHENNSSMALEVWPFASTRSFTKRNRSSRSDFLHNPLMNRAHELRGEFHRRRERMQNMSNISIRTLDL